MPIDFTWVPIWYADTYIDQIEAQLRQYGATGAAAWLPPWYIQRQSDPGKFSAQFAAAGRTWGQGDVGPIKVLAPQTPGESMTKAQLAVSSFVGNLDNYAVGVVENAARAAKLGEPMAFSSSPGINLTLGNIGSPGGGTFGGINTGGGWGTGSTIDQIIRGLGGIAGATGLTDSCTSLLFSLPPDIAGYQKCKNAGGTGLIEKGVQLLPGTQQGEATIGAFGTPARKPVKRSREVAVCGAGFILGKDGLCYVKGTIPRQFRKWRPETRPPLTAADAKAIRRAAGAKKRVKKLASSVGLSTSARGRSSSRPTRKK